MCGESRGFIYSGPVYGQEELDSSICPWCIADGSAAEKFDAEFTDVGSGIPADVPDDVVARGRRPHSWFFGMATRTLALPLW